MFQRIFVIVTMLCAATPALGQQLPGAHEGKPPKQVPGAHDGSVRRPASCEDQLAQLQKLVSAQEQKIALLQAKIDLLQKPPSGTEGAGP